MLSNSPSPRHAPRPRVHVYAKKAPQAAALTQLTARPWSEILAAAFFLVSLLSLILVTPRFVRSKTSPQTRPAKGMVDVMSLTRTPTVTQGSLRYAVLGLGQDPDSGRQIVWIRSLVSNRIDGFAVGERLFGGPVKIRAIRPDEVAFMYRKNVTTVPLRP